MGGKLFTEPLSSNGRLLWLHYSGLQASCHIIKMYIESYAFLLGVVYQVKDNERTVVETS
jgi:hypothetical protein